MHNNYEEAVSAMIEDLSTPDDPEAIQKKEEEPTKEDLEAELQRLKAELSALREELESKVREQARAMAELEEFQQLYPEISPKDLPQSVRDQVAEGVPLSAAYALFEKRAATAQKHASAVNKRNASLSAGRVGQDTAEEYFTPDEVRAMSQKQVHENYQKILESMKSWI